MNYEKLTKKQLVSIIEELQLLNQQLLSENEQMAGLDFAWTGNLGHWYWNIKTNAVTFNPLKVTSLGYKKEEIPEKTSYQFFTEKLHPEDYQRAMEAMRDHLSGKASVYEVEYRIQTKTGAYKWFHDRGRITRYDEEGRPLLMAGIVFDITAKKEIQNVTERKNIILSELSSTDGLTNLKNYRALIVHLSGEVDCARHHQKPLAIAMLDIDDFKKINDEKGHLFGNKVLINIAELLRKNLRDSDFAGRFGGEEFMIIFPKTDLNDAASIVERIRKSVENYSFGDAVKVTVSGGLRGYHGEELTGLIEAADINLYEAKKRGKNQIICT